MKILKDLKGRMLVDDSLCDASERTRQKGLSQDRWYRAEDGP